MKRIFCPIVFLAFLIVVGCHRECSTQLGFLEYSLEDNPDSVYTILQALHSESKNYNEKDRMRYGLMRLKCQNILDLPFDSKDTIDAIVDYYENNGTYNEALLAMYLKGRSYVVKENEPMAMECFNKCLALKADSDEEVDYIQLSKVHSQMSRIYDNQKIPMCHIKELEAAVNCAYKGGDTLLALTYQHLNTHPFYNMGMMDSVINIVEEVREKYLALGMKDKAAGILYMSFIAYLEKKEYDDAKRCLNIYESESGVIDSLGNTVEGREIFYYHKGRLYEAYGQRDSAEYQYRKLLGYGEDINNLEGAYKGLLSIYRFKGNSDSIGKYADLYCEINDTVHARKVAYDISRLKAMYDYSEYKQKNEEMMLKAETTRSMMIVVTFFAFFIFIFAAYQIHIYRKRKQMELNNLLEEYDRTLQMIDDLNGDKDEMIQNHQDELETIRAMLKAKGISLTNENKGISINDDILMKFRKCGEIGVTAAITSEDWQRLFFEMTDSEHAFMLVLREKNLTENERKVVCLIRLRFGDYLIKNILGVSASSFSNYKVRINKKLFNESDTRGLRRKIYALKH